ncbi:hypothetical protein NST04_10800 [Paenibacillus sp. FSL H7-0756]|uniref:DUF4064 domain-containing protein n=1 Tax=Paenibacillus silagei TaxID=1670801 RepID=A0ABS4NWJ5_9BACL|nr:hypothetical protein [Paenibacillus silagei]MBP2114427.1 hypothetical protein [Paenibacillus silagei]OMF96596.1 hypothetical protein BK146_14650 [Paenibacillus sp. FSL R7-0333]
MVRPVRILWISAVVVNIVGLALFLLQTSPGFSQGFILDVVNIMLLQILGIPSAVLVVASLLLLKYTRKPPGWAGYIGIFIMIGALLWIGGYFLLFARLMLFENVR